jgi:hypothetical protein
VKKLQDKLQHSKHDGSALAVMTSENVTVDWEEFYQTVPEAPCCITAAETTPVEFTWPEADGILPDQPPVLQGNTLIEPLAYVTTSETSPASVGDKVTGMKGTTLDPDIGAKYILQYDIRVSFCLY